MKGMERRDFGYFKDNGREYVVTEVNTPLPFVNYFWNNRFISGVSQHMAGIGCFTERPIQYMDPDCRCNMVRDENRHFYMRDDESGEIWSPGWYPVLTELDEYKCRHGLGYSILESRYKDIKTSLRVFVPLEGPVEIWTITITNVGSKDHTIKTYSFVDWLLTGYEEYCDYHSALSSVYDNKNNLLVSFNETSERPHDFFNGFIASDRSATGFDSSRKAFLGYAQVDRPAAVVNGRCSNSLGVAEKLVGVLEHTFYLKPGQQETYHVMIGATDSLNTAQETCSKFFRPGNVEKEFQDVLSKLHNDYSKVQVQTPETKINYLFNGWIKRSVQLHTEVGTDTGKGLRDILQAAWAVSSYDPEGAREKIIESLRHQYADGHTLRGWNPVDTHHYSDGPVWIAPAVDSYLKESGDYDFLNVVVPYFDEGEATVWDHVLTSIRHSTEDLGPHGLIRAHYGDWNDSLNMMGTGGIGESVWTSIAMIFSINSAKEIAKHVLKDDQIVQELECRAERLTKAINEYGWDGEWYLEGINDSGHKVGSHQEQEGRVYLNPQTWAIMGGIVTPEKLPSILKVIDEDLECDYGSLVLTPAYKKPNPGIGRLSWFTPGMWENASPYCHGTSFKIVADTYIKRGNEAFRSFMKVLPDSDLNPSSHSGCPPYMVTNMYYGPEHPRKGQILYSWITGTADWLFKGLTSHMIGVRATYDGLIIDPCVPDKWDRFSIKRSFRGTQYEVEFFNPEGKQSGVSSVEVDGQIIEGNLLPLFTDGKVHKVKVIM